MLSCPAMLREFAWVGLGSNVGERAAWLERGRQGLARLAEGPLRLSPIVETPPWGLPGQPAYLNQVVGFRPRLAARRTLRALQEVERGCARRRDRRWGPRTLDLDLLSWPLPVPADAALHLPHPRLAERRFVLAPWAAVAPTLQIPGLGSVADLLARCPDRSWLRWSP